MPASLNRVQLLGHLGADPEVRNLPEGARVANFSVATSDKWTDKESGEPREKVEWSRICIFSEPLVALAEKYLKKGSRIFIEGSLHTRKYEKDGSTHYATEVVLRPYSGSLTLLDAPARGPERATEPAKPAPAANRRNAPRQPRPAA
jgi:single-strand DNA-binding protein